MIVLKANCKYRTWEDLVQEPGNVIGTSSVRRQAQLRARWPNLKFNDIRGNLNTRLRKLDDENGPYQALILAAAGILRLDWEQRIHRVPSYLVLTSYIKFIYSEKATKFCEISPQLFDWQYIGQIIGGDFAKFCGHLRIYELYNI